MRYTHRATLHQRTGEDASGNATYHPAKGLRCLLVDLSYTERQRTDGTLSEDTARVYIHPDGYRDDWDMTQGDTLDVSGTGIASRSLRVTHIAPVGPPGRAHHVEVRGAD